jgi:glycosyltransferase involved in cell wall biosynthesis
MEANHQVLCLNMIVKDEAPVIARCLASVRPIIDYWVIVDTGSTDGTQDAIRTLMADLPGELHERHWRDFAHNRTEALELAQPHGEYVLIIDADDVLEFEPQFKMPALQADSYMLRIADTSISYDRTQIVRAALPWRWRGVLHEFLTCDDARSSGLLEGLRLRRNHDGARRRDPQTYRRDTEILYAALQTESDPFMQSRYQFYLAQSYSDCGEKEKALRAYLKRAKLGFWVEEVFMSLYSAAKLQEALGYPNEEVLTAYTKAAAACPTRAEALHNAARFCREKGLYERGYEFATKGLAIAYPTDALFVHDWVYQYGLLDELAVCAYWTERYAACVSACDRLLNEGKLPADMRDRVLKNRNFAVGKQQESIAASSSDSARYLNLLHAAREKEGVGGPGDEIIAAYLEAATAGPMHGEALHSAARYCRNNALYERGYEFAAKGLAIAYPNDGLPNEDWICQYGLLDELAVCAYWTKRYTECVSACDRLLREGKMPTDMRDRVVKNRNFAIGKQQEIIAASSPDLGDYIRLLRAAREKERLSGSSEEIIAAYIKAAAAGPTRAEALHDAARFCRQKSLYERGYEFAAKGLAIAYPNDRLPIEDWIYQYGLLDEFAVHAYWTEQYQECLDACQRLIRERQMPTDMYDRVKKNAELAAEKLGLQKPQQAITGSRSPTRSTWIPEAPAGGTELMVAGLRERLGGELDRINLQVNHPGHDISDKRPRVVWMHHDVDQRWVQWCKDRELVESVNCFVFISSWQREQYLTQFGLPAQRCFVLKHALNLNSEPHRWEPGPIWRCAYTSTPFRGLDVLLDAWERLSPMNAELHLWSSMKLYLADDGPYEHLYKRAEAMPNVTYHGLAPNAELRAALRNMHFLVYPCTFRETSCLAVIEAMAAGCRVITSSLGALPETTGGYARIYPSIPDRQEHAAQFAENLAAEIAMPWSGHSELSLSQQAHCAAVYSWPKRIAEWKELIETIASQTAKPIFDTRS